MVEPFPTREGWNVHETTRLALRHRLASQDSVRFSTLSAQAAKCFENNDPAWRIEAIYHRLLASPEEGAGELKRLWKEWDDAGQYERLQALGVALEELICTQDLEPSARARACVSLGWIGLGRLKIRQSKDLAREALKIFQDLGYAAGEVDARQQLGNALLAEGDLLREYIACREIGTRLTQRDPENTGWQRDLSVSHNCVGRVFQDQGRLAAALREFESSKQIRLSLTQRDPENAGWKEDLNATRTCIDQMQHRLPLHE